MHLFDKFLPDVSSPAPPQRARMRRFNQSKISHVLVSGKAISTPECGENSASNPGKAELTALPRVTWPVQMSAYIPLRYDT